MKKGTFLLFLLLLLTACGGATSPSDSRVASSESPIIAVESPRAAPSGEMEEAGGGDTSGRADTNGAEVQAQQSNRKIIYTANLTLRVEEPRQSAKTLEGLAAKYGGYISNANIYEYSEDVYQGTVQLRVNAEQFEGALAELRGLALEVLTEQRDSQDVTAQFVDVSARIENLERTETELQALLTEAREKGGKTEDVLSVYRELTNVREQIELYQGQLNVLDDSVDLATINLSLVPPEVEVEVVDEEWNPARTLRQALRALTEGLQGLTDMVIVFVVSVLPFLLVVGAMLYVAFAIASWFWQRRPRVRRTPPPPPPSATKPTE